MYPLANVVQHTRPALAELGDKANVPAVPRQRKDSKELSNEPAGKDANAGKKRSRTTEEPQEEFDDSGSRPARVFPSTRTATRCAA